MGDTISKKSMVGRRLDKIQKNELWEIVFKKKNIPIVSQISIGRDDTNDITVDNPLVSRHHAVIHKIKKEYYVKDLDSTNGTFVNDVKIPRGKYIRLNREDVISVGKSSLKIT